MKLKSKVLNDGFINEFVSLFIKNYSTIDSPKNIYKWEIKQIVSTENISISMVYKKTELLITVSNDMQPAQIVDKLLEAIMNTFPEDFI